MIRDVIEGNWYIVVEIWTSFKFDTGIKMGLKEYPLCFYVYTKGHSEYSTYISHLYKLQTIL